MSSGLRLTDGLVRPQIQIRSERAYWQISLSKSHGCSEADISLSGTATVTVVNCMHLSICCRTGGVRPAGLPPMRPGRWLQQGGELPRMYTPLHTEWYTEWDAA